MTSGVAPFIEWYRLCGIACFPNNHIGDSRRFQNTESICHTFTTGFAIEERSPANYSGIATIRGLQQQGDYSNKGITAAAATP